jgi:tRNA A-37 threonylcarbamoyl transferase component Bud32
LQVPDHAENENDYLYVLKQIEGQGQKGQLALVRPIDGGRLRVWADVEDGARRSWEEFLGTASGREWWIACEFGKALDEKRTEGSFLSEDYEVIGDPLGAGAFGTVYRVRHVRTGQEWAIKALKDEHRQRSDVVARFERELRIMSELRHPRILPADREEGRGGRLLIRMPYVPGGTIRDALRERAGALPEERVRHWATQLFEALEAIHAQGIVHRDVKPENLLLDARDDLFLSDFGIARLLPGAAGASGETGLTVDGAPRTPLYAAPEMAEPGQPHVAGASDVYSAAVVLRELLTGQVPKRGERPSDGLSGRWHAFLARCDATDPQRRCTATQALALLRALGGGTSPQPAEPTVAASAPVGEAPLDLVRAERLGRLLREALEDGRNFPASCRPWDERRLADGSSLGAAWGALRSAHIGLSWQHLYHHPWVTAAVVSGSSRRAWNRERVCAKLVELAGGSQGELAERREAVEADLGSLESLEARFPATALRLRDWIGALGISRDLFGEERLVLERLLRALPGLSRAKVRELAERQDWGTILRAIPEARYQRRRLAKRDGGRRWIHEPDPTLRRVQMALARVLRLSIPGHPAATAFLPQRSIGLHARLHAGARGAVVIDIHDFFGSVCFEQVSEALAHEGVMRKAGYWGCGLRDWSPEGRLVFEWLCFWQEPTRAREFLPQGAPTSPALANIAAYPMDARILAVGRHMLTDETWTYSRYADDLVISSPLGGHRFHERAESLLATAVHSMGWTVSPKKIRHWSSARGGPLILCGATVPAGPSGPVRLPRPVRRRLRAAFTEVTSGSTAAEAHGLLSHAYSVTGRHALLAACRGRVRETVRRMGFAVSGGEPALADAFVTGWLANALE